MKEETGLFIFLGVSIFALGFFFGMLMWIGEYKKGQVDALTGNIQYELIEQPDKSVMWEKIK